MSAVEGGTVLLVANNFPPVRGGSAVVYDNLARHAGGRIIVVAPRVNYADGLSLIGWREHDRCAPYRVVRLRLLRTVIAPSPRRRPARLLFLARDLVIRAHLAGTLLRLVRQERVSAICVGELLASGWVLRLLRLVPRLRTLVYVHGEEITTDDQYDVGARRRRQALRDADIIIVVSRFTLRAVEALLGGAAEGKLSLIENGVDTTRFVPRAKNPDLLALYGLSGCFVFVSVCRLLEKKGVDNAIRAFAQVVARHPDSRYLVVGTGPYEARLRAIATEMGVAEAVVFAGQVAETELVEHYRLGDVFVMPNRELANGDTEGFGLVFLEANGCGLPVIAGRDGGSTDAVKDGVNGLVVDGTAVPEIAAAMLSLYEDAALWALLRRGGLEAAVHADWSDKTATFLQICSRPKWR